jgi:hypothetical protein
MKTNGSDWKDKVKDKSKSEQLFDSLLFYRQLASLHIERLRIIKELECLLSEDQTKFTEYLSETIHQYEMECEIVLDVDEDDPVPEGFKDAYYDKNTTLVQYLYAKRMLILAFLQELKALLNKENTERIAAVLKEAHGKDVSEILNAKKRIEQDFSLLENLTIKTIEGSPDDQAKESIKKSLEEMRDNFRKNGFNV